MDLRWRLRMNFSDQYKQWRYFNRHLKPWKGRTKNLIEGLRGSALDLGV
jgi:hypothetical protein